MNRQHSKGVVLLIALVFTLCAGILLAAVLRYVSTTSRLSAIYAGRTPCRLAAHAAIEKARGKVYQAFKGTAKNRALLFNSTAFNWFQNWTPTSIGTGSSIVSFDGVNDIFPGGTFNGCTVRVRLRSAPVIEGSRAIVTLYATAQRATPAGVPCSVTIAERVAFGVDRSKVFDHAYFVNNYGWFEGSTITANGDVRANGDMSLSQSPKVNGHVYGAYNEELGVSGKIKNGTGTMDNKSTYLGTQYGTSNRARPLQENPGDGGYEAPVQVTTQDLNARLHGELAEGLDMPWISDLNQYVKYAQELGSTLKVGNEVKISGSDGYYKGLGPSGRADMPDNHALVLEGTQANPIRLNGPVVVSNDVVIKGYVTGQGTIYSARNIHIVGNIQYVNPPTWNSKKINTGNSSKDLLGLAAKGNIVMGDCTSSSWLSSTLSKVLTQSPYVQKYKCAQAEDGTWSDGDIGYPKAGQTVFGGNYTVADGGAKITETKKELSHTEYTYDKRGRVTGSQKVIDGYEYTYTKNTQRRYYDSVVPPHEISSRASTITQIDAVLYNNHGIFGNIGSCTINGSLVCRNEGLIFSGNLFLNWDYRLYSGSPESVANSLVGMPVATSAPKILSWQEVPDSWNEDSTTSTRR